VSDLFDLSGRRALVTGANKGIGQAIAIALAGQRANVVCAGRRPSDETTQLIAANGGKASNILLDFADPAAAQDIFEGQGFSILVNNAGIIRREDSVDFTESDWDDVMNVNLKSLFLSSQAFAREIFATEATGSIVNIASLLSFQGGIRVPSYTASKHGVAGVTKTLANEWAARGINVNAIAPGYIKTNNTQALRDDPDRSQALLSRIPAGRWGEAEDIGGAAAFLCSPAAKYIHGTILAVDGGWLAY
jgi:2-deoxy-D-gluconate 3-dehydrogenase